MWNILEGAGDNCWEESMERHCMNDILVTKGWGHAVVQLVEALRYKPEGCGFDSRWCHWYFLWTFSFWPHFGPEVDSVSNRNEYQEYFLGGKGGRCLRLTTLPLACAKCHEIWEPEPPGTLRTCPGLYRDCFTYTSYRRLPWFTCEPVFLPCWYTWILLKNPVNGFEIALKSTYTIWKSVYCCQNHEPSTTHASPWLIQCAAVLRHLNVVVTSTL
jgi:hypothetical protein